jgi:putative ABC transport system permease protein
VQNERLLAQVGSIFGGSFLLLTGVGLRAFASYLLLLRTGDLAIRAALGAAPAQIVSTLWRELSGVVAAGAALGWLASAASRRVLASVMPETMGVGLLEALLGVVILVAVVVSAGLPPTLQAIRMDIARALRANQGRVPPWQYSGRLLAPPRMRAGS